MHCQLIISLCSVAVFTLRMVRVSGRTGLSSLSAWEYCVAEDGAAWLQDTVSNVVVVEHQLNGKRTEMNQWQWALQLTTCLARFLLLLLTWQRGFIIRWWWEPLALPPRLRHFPIVYCCWRLTSVLHSLVALFSPLTTEWYVQQQ